MCLADFFAHYEIGTKPLLNDSQPDELPDEVLDLNHEPLIHNLPKRLKLDNENGDVMKLRKVKKVVRFHCPNQVKYPEKYAHHLLLMYKPFRSETQLETDGSYLLTLQDPEIQSAVNERKRIFEPFSDLIDEALTNFQQVLRPDPILDYENDETEEQGSSRSQFNNDDHDDDEMTSIDLDIPPVPTVLPDEDINSSIRSLNTGQREIFESVNHWARTKLKSLNSTCVNKVEPLRLFLTGKGGCGKSYVVRTVYNHLTKLFSYRTTKEEKVLLLAPTGIAAVNINGETFYHALSLSHNCKYMKVLPRLSAKKRDELRRRFSELQVLIIDEISMVDQMELQHISGRLNEIFGCVPNEIFAGLTVILSGDLLQLPPVKGIPAYTADPRRPMLSLCKLWNEFKMAELDECMRQTDNTFINFLNRCRIGELSNDDIDLFKSRHVDNFDYPRDSVHLSAENKPSNEYNKIML